MIELEGRGARPCHMKPSCSASRAASRASPSIGRTSSTASTCACTRKCGTRSSVARRAARVLVLSGAGRGFCAGQDLADRAVAPGGAERRSRRLDRALLQAAGARFARSADARDRGGQRRGGGRGREYRARLRSGDRGALGELRSGVLPARPGPGLGRNVELAAPRRRCARARLDAARRKAVRPSRRPPGE